VGAPRKYDYDPDRILAAARGAKSLAEVAIRCGIEPTALSKHLGHEHDLKADILTVIGRADDPRITPPRPTTVSSGTPLTVDAEIADLRDIETMLTGRGLNAVEWKVARARVNEWGSATCKACEATVEPLRQLRVDLDPRSDLLMPARVDGPRFKTAKPRACKAGGRVLFLADPHAPYHDEGALHALAAWTDRTGPVDRVVILGDVLDLPGVSRHRSMPGEPSTQQCIDGGYDWLRSVREIVGAAPIEWVPGNHDARIGLFALDNANALADIRQANNGPHALGLTWLLRLDELAISLHEHAHGWESGELEITPSLAAWHAPPSKRQADVIRYSVIHGHHHAQTWQTIPIMDQRNAVVGRRMIVGAGTMSDFRTGLGYAKAPGWTQGWCWADLWDDGEHEIAHVRYRDGEAWWPGGRLKVPAWRGSSS